MSQIQRRAGDDTNTTTTTTTSSQQQPRKLSASPPTRSLLSSSTSHSSLAGNLIPRDYLGLRTAAAPSTAATTPATAATATDSRKPSPLHTSFGPPALRRDSPESSLSPLSPRSTAGSRSPLHAQLSGGRRAQPALSPSSASSDEVSRERSDSSSRNIADVRSDHARDMADRSHLLQDRITAGTPDSLPSSGMSPVSPENSQLPKLRDRPGQRVMPRTSSIDSAISALSSASHAHKSSFDANSLSPSDISQLIATAGSAEAVIVHLLKEKHHAASQNAQLWRLVDKQRALILGLNKDLERALKEKEKYKKKVKELQGAVAPVPLSVSASSLVQPPDEPPENRSAPTVSSPSADEPNKALSNHDTQWTVTGPQGNAPPVGQELVDRARGDTPLDERDRAPSSVNQKSRRQTGFDSRPDTASSDEAADDFLPIQGAPEKIPHPSRRPPPAPLTLVPERTPPADSLSDDSESEYEDLLGVSQPSREDRGRRKTREDDDREREEALVRERESRSASKKKPKPAKSSQPPAGAAKETAEAAAGPTGPHTHIPISLQPGAAATDELHLPSGSAEGQFLSSPVDRMIALPPKSPGLPMSPRPVDRPLGSPMPRDPRDLSHPVASPPMSPSGPLPVLPQSPRANKSPSASAQPEGSTHVPVKANGNVPGPISVDLANRPIPSIDAAIQIDSPHSASPVQIQSSIYRGLMSDDYPNLLLPPNALPLIQVRVYSSRLRPSRNSYLGPRPADEEPVFTLSVFSRSEHRELWRVEKVIAALPQLDQQVRQHCKLPVKVPDRSIFSGHSPAKVDARRAALNAYFEALLDTPMDERAAVIICQFLTMDAIQARDDETTLLDSTGPSKPEILRGPDGRPRKEGYLTKRGKNFGGWKARYFVLHGPELKYFESPGGAHLGTIKLPHAQIGKQSQSAAARSSSPTRTTDDDPDNQYRHAFLILEPKKKDSSALVRHVLCAESDEERDAWVDVLLEYVEGGGSDHETSTAAPTKTQSHPPAKQASGPKGRLFQRDNKKAGGKAIDGYEYESPETVQGFSYDDAVPAEPPILGTSLDTAPQRPSHKTPALTAESVNAGLYSNSPTEQRQLGSFPSVLISGPTNGAVIQDAGAWGNKAATSTKEKKRSIWGFRRGSSIDLASQLQAHEQAMAQASSNHSSDRREPIRPVFGMPLAEAVVYCGPTGIESELPAVVYRCIEYLQAKDAQLEEGIFRLSGSNVVIKALKERFNTEGDIDFLADDQYYDVHAVASLFKQYLRELPTTVLTRDLHLDFLRVLELDDKQKKIIAFNTLVHKLPKPNLALLKALTEFLLGIVNNSDVNKMTVRNVGIVFAPTLNIPAPVFATFLTEFDSIFGSPADSASAQTVELGVNPSLAPEDIRSPRHQMFSDIPTPAYNQTSFQGSESGKDTGPGHRNVHPQVDTGFVPMQYTYEPHPYKTEPSDYNHANGGQSSITRMLAPGMENGQSMKAKRRESSLLFMDPNNRRHSTILSFADTKMTEESGYE